MTDNPFAGIVAKCEVIVREALDANFGPVDQRATMPTSWVSFIVEVTARVITDQVEGPGSPLCDCDEHESLPTDPRNRAIVIDHHCDCLAVAAAGRILGDIYLTRHYAQQCGHAKPVTP